MEINRYTSDLLLSNMYIISEKGHAIVIDPFCDTTHASGLVIDKILLTHEHYDHISGVNLWKKETRAKVLCTKQCAENIKTPSKNLSNHFKEFCELQTWMRPNKTLIENPNYSCNADETFENEMSFKWLGHKWHLFELPGHSMGSMGIVLDGKIFFSGDSLMEGFEIELRMPGGSKKKWKEIGEPRIKALPEGILVCPGHFREFNYKKYREEELGDVT